jgi:hypothetical protein
MENLPMAQNVANKQRTWLDALYFLMVLTSVVGLLYVFIHN